MKVLNATALTVTAQIAAIPIAMADCHCQDAQVWTVARSFAVVRYAAFRPVAGEAHYAAAPPRGAPVHCVAPAVDKWAAENRYVSQDVRVLIVRDFATVFHLNPIRQASRRVSDVTEDRSMDWKV